MRQKILAIVAAVLAIAIIGITVGTQAADITPACVKGLEKGLNQQDITQIQSVCLPSDGEMAALSAGVLLSEISAVSSDPTVKILMAGEIEEIDSENKEFMTIIMVQDSNSGQTVGVLPMKMAMASEGGKWYLKMS